MHQALTVQRCGRPSRHQNATRDEYGFRGSITRPPFSLSTLRLRRYRRLRKTRYQLVASLYWTGLQPAGIPWKVSVTSLTRYITSPFPRLCLAHAGPRPGRRSGMLSYANAGRSMCNVRQPPAGPRPGRRSGMLSYANAGRSMCNVRQPPAGPRPGRRSAMSIPAIVERRLLVTPWAGRSGPGRAPARKRAPSARVPSQRDVGQHDCREARCLETTGRTLPSITPRRASRRRDPTAASSATTRLPTPAR
jgi:hypothetical protein